MEEQNSIYLQRLCGAVKQVQIEASQTNEFLVRDGRSPLQLCGRYEDIFSHRYRYSTLSLLKKKPGFWGVLKDISRKEALTRIKNLQHPETDLGRCRAWIRMAANENSLFAYIIALQSNPDLLTKYYEPQAFLRDQDLTEAAINVLSGLETFRFELTLDTASLEIEIAPDAYVPADKISRLMALELARSVQLSYPSGPVQIERKPHRKKRRQPKQSPQSHSTDTDSPECPDSESDYGSMMKPVVTSPLTVNQLGGRKPNIGLSSSFENSQGAMFSDSSLTRGFGLSSSAPAPHPVILKTPNFISERKEALSSPEQIVEKSVDIPEFLSPIFENEPTYEHENEIVRETNEPQIDITEEIEKTDHSDLILDSTDPIPPTTNPFGSESPPPDRDEVHSKDRTELKLDLTPEIAVPIIEQPSSQKSKLFHSCELRAELEPNIESKKSFESIEDETIAEKSFKTPITFASPMQFNSSTSLPIQSLLTANAVIATPVSTPQPKMDRSDSDEFYSINGEWDVIHSEDFSSLDEVSIENLDTNPLILNQRDDDYFRQEINVDRLHINEVYSTMKKIIEELKTVDPQHPSYKILVHTLVKLRIRRLEINEGKVPPRGKGKKIMKIFGHCLEINSGKVQSKSCDICDKSFTAINFKKKWSECNECGLVLHAQCAKKIPSICPAQGTPKYILAITNERGLLFQKFRCKNCSRPIGVDSRDESLLCRYTGYYYCPECYSKKPAILPAKIVHDWDFELRNVSLTSYLTLKLIHSYPRIDLSQENPLIYSYVDTLAECSTVRQALKQMFVFLSVCQDAKECGLLSVHQGILHDHIWKDKEPWSIEDLCSVKQGRFLPALKTFFTKWNSHIRLCARCSGNGHSCLVCHSEDIIFPWDILATSCPSCGILSHSTCVNSDVCPRCRLRAQRMETVSK